jgi:hypothetical protein
MSSNTAFDDDVKQANQPQSQPVASPAAAAPTGPAPSGSGTVFDDDAQTHAAQYKQPTSQNGEGTISAYTPTVWDRVEHMFRASSPNTRPLVQDRAEGREHGDMTIISPQEYHNEREKSEHPMETAFGEFVSDMTTPENVLQLIATEGLGAATPFLKGGMKILPRLISAGFSGQMLQSAYKQYPAVKAAFAKGDVNEVERLLTHITLTVGMAALAGQHAAKGGEAVSKPTQYEDAQSKVRQNESEEFFPTQANSNNQNPYAPKEKGTVAGPRTNVRPTTVKTAGVEAPIAAVQQANAPLAARLAGHLASPGAAKDFQQTRTVPAASRQLVSTLGQRLEDVNNAHNALVDGEEKPEALAGTQQPSQYQTIDDAVRASKQTVKKTWDRADDIDSREQKAWEQQRDAAVSEHKQLLDEHNQNVTEHNSNLAKGETPMEPMAYDQNQVSIPEKPRTLAELRSAEQEAWTNAKSSDAAVRQTAYDKDLPKAEKDLDNWFKKHEDEISPEEWNSAKSVYRTASRMQDIANSLRAPMLKASETGGGLTGNTLRAIEARINNQAVRRGQTPDAFRKLLGPEAYDNWKNVSRVLDPVKGPSKIEQGLEYFASAFLGHLAPLGFAGKAMTEFLMNRVLFHPEWGKWFTNFFGRFKQTGAIAPEAQDEFTRLMKNTKMSNQELLDAGYTQAQIDRGIHLPGVGGGSASTVSLPTANQFDAHMQNGGSTFSPQGDDMSGTDAHAVSAYPERTERIGQDFNPEHLEDFKSKNADLLSRPDHAVGTWQDPDNGLHTLDVNRLIGNRDEAVRVGKLANQKSIYHLGTGELIDTGGTGESPKNLQDVVSNYNRSIDKPAVKDIKTPVSQKVADRIADEYDKLNHDPSNPKVQKAYGALIDETKAQWKALEAAGYKLQPEDTDPYGGTDTPAYEEMAEDVKNNKRIKVWTGGEPPADHPLSKIDPETGVSFNTLFRAVHDIMGHVAGGNNFTQQGEEDAYQRHAQSYSKAALPALTTETRGQTSHYFNNAKVRAGGKNFFVDQRAGLLPDDLNSANVHGPKMQMHHWSNKEGLTETDPEQMGTGGFGAERVRFDEPGFPKRTYFGLEGFQEPRVQGRKFHYVADVDPTRYYDAQEDPEGIWQQGFQEGGATEAEKAVKNAGYAGYHVGDTAASFDKVPVRLHEPTVGSQAGAKADTDFMAQAKKNLPNGTLSQQLLEAQRLKDTRNEPVKHYPDQGFGKETSVPAPAKAQSDSQVTHYPDPRFGKEISVPAPATKAPTLPSMLPPEPENKASLENKEITTRRPTSVSGDLANNPNQHANMDAVHQAGAARPTRVAENGNTVMGYKEKMARTVATYTGVRYTPEELNNPDKVIGKFVNRTANNLEWLYNQVPEPLRAKTRQWYDSAHELTKQLANQYGFTHEQAAAVTAALSPQNPWDNNVGLAKRMMDIYRNRQDFDFTPEMERTVADLKKVPTQSKAFKGLLKDVAGKKLSDFKDADPDVRAVKQALWVRLYDEAHNSEVNDQYAPTGEVMGHSPDNRSWIGLDHMAKAVKILNDGSINSINANMGFGHKIRNFYNNIINPNSNNGHVTIDSHAVAASHLQPFGAKDAEAVHSFGSTNPGIPGAPKDAATGLRGTYPLYAEAYQRVAKKLGILPRELQSVAWEAIKSLMGDSKKTPELKARTREIWQDVQDGKLTPNKARDMIKSEANGFSKPVWMSDEEWEKIHPEEGDTSFEFGGSNE